jgi:hypothetical protein
MYLLQLWFSLSDVQAESQCQDRMSFRKFLGIVFIVGETGYFARLCFEEC